MTPRVVCNTGPLIALSVLERVDLLTDLFDEVLVPTPVHREIVAGGPAGAGVDAYRGSTVWRVDPSHSHR